MKITIRRTILEQTYTLGVMEIDGKHFGYTCEDSDRQLEVEGNEKIKGKTAIPRGRYEVVLSFSHRFQRTMPEILNVPGFTGVRIHGGNTHEDTEGCPLLGARPIANGVAECKIVNQRLIDLIEAAEESGEEVSLEIV